MEYAYLVWSNEHGAWWGPDRCGYYTDIEAAGCYSLSDAIEICEDAGFGDGQPQETIFPYRLPDKALGHA